MPDTPEPREGWHKPNDAEGQETPLRGVWYKPPTALSEEQLAQLRQAPPPSLPEPTLSRSPAVTGGWYDPDGAESQPISVTEPVEPAPVADPKAGLFDYIAKINSPQVQGQFDASKSKLLEGIQPDLGKFDDAKSGVLGGIGAEPVAEEPILEPDLGTFDASLSGALAGIEPDLGAFDDSKSGVLGGIEAEEKPFDDSKSGALTGIGAEATGEVAHVGGGSDTTANPSPTQALAEPQMQTIVVEELPQQYKDVEQKVAAFRQQFEAGQISRQQLQEELRKLMIIDEAGRWWMLGLESNKWYRYDGREWVTDEPPKKQVVIQQAVPTETGLQAVVGAGQVSAAMPKTDNLPLPIRVPVDDPSATLVNQRAINLDEHRSWEAPTLSGIQQASAEGGIESPVPFSAEATVPSMRSFDPNQPGAGEHFGAVEPVLGGGLGGGINNQIPSSPAAPLPHDYRPHRPKMNGIQPDYSAAFSGYWDRGTTWKWGLRLSIAAMVLILVLSLLTVLGMLGYYFSIVNKYSSTIDNMGQRAAAFETTIIYDGEGNVIAEFNDPTGGARKSVPLNEISPFLIHATVSTEDETFYENRGFSIWGIGRAIYQNIRTGGGGGGASTITQQLARALVLDADFAAQRSVERKTEEIIVAAEIARKYSKNEILAFYLNEIYYGNQAYGIQAASELYFNKPAKDLNIAEAAFLAGLPQAPAVYDPVVNRQTAVDRMGQVLRLMTEANGNGCIQMQHEPQNAAPFCVTQAEIDDTYIIQIAEVQIKIFSPPRYDVKYPHFVNYVRQELEEQYGSQRIYSAGFRVYTTLVPGVQDTAQRAVLEEIPQTPGANNGSVVAMRPRDGAVLALVGSADFNNDEIDGQVNVAFTPQQPGSTMKPFVYLGSLEGIGENDYWYPGTIIWDVPSCWGNYCPTNYDFSVNGPMTMRLALVRSMNVPAVKGLAYITPDRLTTILNRFNVRLPGDTPTEAGLPAALGAVDVYLFDMTAAYGALANGGVYQSPYAIQRIVDIDGEVVYEANPNPEGLPVAAPEYTYLISDMLSDPTIREAASLNIPGWRTAAKTGTTNDNRDVWTVGYTSDVAIGVWVGRTDNQPMASTVFGSNTAAPIWNKTMQAALAGIQPHDFPRPSAIGDYQVCSDTGAQYSPTTCPSGETRQEVAYANQPPPSAENGFLVTARVDSFSGLLANDNCPEFVVDRTFINITDQTAITWINTTQGGQTWAQVRNIKTPVSPPPTESCTPNMPRPRLVISQPTANQEVGGLASITGTVTVPNFTNFEFQLASVDTDPNTFTGPVGQVLTTQQPNANGPLTTIDFSPYPNGNYILRLVARGQNNAEAHIDVPIRINNQVILPTPTFAPTLTPAVNVFEPTFTPTTDPFAIQGGIPQPTVDPFLPVPPTTNP